MVFAANDIFLSEYDFYLLREGTHYRSYQKMGAHLAQVNNSLGVHFAVWAPNAHYLSVIGDFNAWDRWANPLQSQGDSGIWEGFVPNAKPGDCYKYFIESNQFGYRTERADPYAFFAELRPRTASVIWDINKYHWHDQQWMQERVSKNAFDRPMMIYELHLGSWKRSPESGHRWLTYRELAQELPVYLQDMGFTHVELMPITEHPLDASWGYQSLGYFAPTSRFGPPEDFMFLIDKLHQAGIGVILDWVPAHFPNDEFGLAFFDGTHLYEHADPRKGYHPDWGTYVFNFGRAEVANFLISSAMFWLDKYHIDGLRVDAVASMLYLDYSRKEGEWIPNQFGGREDLDAINFIQRLNQIVYQQNPGIITMAEESTSWPMVSRPPEIGGLGFGYKWNMGWMNDILSYMSKEPVHRSHHHNQLTFGLLYAFHENFVLPLSHDEVVHGKGSLLNKMPGDDWQKFANLRLLYGFMYGHPGKKLLFMGNEIGTWSEWKVDHSLDWHLLEWDRHQGIQRWVRDLNHFVSSESALYQVDFSHQGFQWIDCNDFLQGIISFLRFNSKADEVMVIVCNFTPVVREGYKIGFPRGGDWKEVLNSDDRYYSGSGQGNNQQRNKIVSTSEESLHGQPFSAALTLPPLGVLFLKPA